MKTHILITALAAFASLAVSTLHAADPVANTEGSKLESKDEKFILKAAQGGMTEAKLGEIAAQKGTHADVKAFGAMMAKDHGMANAELKALATKKGVMLEDKLDNEHNDIAEKFTKMEAGEEFDKEYVQQMVKDHKKTISAFEEAAKDGKDGEVKAFAEKTLPTLKAHLTKIESIEASLKK